MDTKVFISKADLLKEAEERGMKNMTTMKKAEIAEKLGVTLTPRSRLDPDEKRSRMRAYQRRRYHKTKRKTTARRSPPMVVYIHNIFMYMVVLFLFVTNKTLMSFLEIT